MQLEPVTINSGTPVTALAVTSDGRYAVSNGTDATAVVWDLGTGRVTRRLDHSIMGSYSPMQIEMTSDPAVGLAVLPDDRLAICASASSVRLWNIDTGAMMRVLQDLPRPTPETALDAVYTGVGFDFSQWDDFTALLLSADAARALLRPSGPGPCGPWVRAMSPLQQPGVAESIMAVLPDGRRVLSLVQHTGLRLWDLGTGATLHVAEEVPAASIGHPGDITCVTVTPDGGSAVSGSSAGTMSLWDLALGRLARRSSARKSRICAVTVLTGGRHMVVGCEDGSLDLWDVQSLEVVRTLGAHEGPITAIAWVLHGTAVISGSQDAAIRRWPAPAL